MDYEKKYNEALERAKEIKSKILYSHLSTESCKAVSEYIDTIIPELRESKDERIRKEIRQFIFDNIGEISLDDRENAWLEYLEKQKEQKPAWSEVELLFRGEKVTVKRPFYRDDKGRGYSTTEQDEEVAWNALRAWCEKKGISLYDLYPKQEWSEEDEKNLGQVISGRYLPLGLREWFCGLPERFSSRPSWKPSEEQMSMLRAVINEPNNSGAESCQIALRGIYEQLKKL